MARPSVRRRILEAVAELLRAEGPGALTTRAAAARAGVTEASIFNNFGSKAGLLQALVEEVLPQYAELQRRLHAEPAPSLEDWLVEVFLGARDLFAALLPLAGPALVAPAPVEAGEPKFFFSHRTLVKRLQQLRRRGLLSADIDIPAAALLLLGAAMHTAMTGLTLGRQALGGTDRQAARRLVRSLIRARVTENSCPSTL